MNLFQQIERRAYDLCVSVIERTGKEPEAVVAYLGYRQRRELYTTDEFATHLRCSNSTGFHREDNCTIAGCKVIFVNLEDHFNVTLMNPHEH